MQLRSGVCRGLLASALVAALAGPASASTFLRASLEDLSAKNSTIVLGEVVDAVSYWNADHSFILTDVTIATQETIKGDRKETYNLTLLGGTVGRRSALIVDGAELVPGRSYLLFLNVDELPGSPPALTPRCYSQCVFEITAKDGELKAISQARHAHLLADKRGVAEAPGGVEGLPLQNLISELRQLVKRQEEVAR